jgi:hypothetical protein
MGGKSSTSTSTSSSTNVQELNLQDTGGFTIADNKGGTTLNYTNTTTDGGAVSAAADVSQTSLAAMLSALKASLGFAGNTAGSAIGANTATTGAALDLASGLSSDVSHAATTLGQTALDQGFSVANAGLDHAAAAYQSGLTFQNDALNTVANIAQDSLLHQESLTNNAISGFQAIAQQNSASDSTQIQKIAIYAVAAAVLIVVLPAMFKS